MTFGYQLETPAVSGTQTDFATGSDEPVLAAPTVARGQRVSAQEVKALSRKAKGRKAGSWRRLAGLGTAVALLEGMTPQEVASLLGITPSQLRDYLRGERNIPRDLEPVIDDLVTLHMALHSVIDPGATRDWWYTSIPALGGDTPWRRWTAGQHKAVVHLACSYLDPAYA